jgi:hypothetical protein
MTRTLVLTVRPSAASFRHPRCLEQDCFLPERRRNRRGHPRHSLRQARADAGVGPFPALIVIHEWLGAERPGAGASIESGRSRLRRPGGGSRSRQGCQHVRHGARTFARTACTPCQARPSRRIRVLRVPALRQLETGSGRSDGAWALLARCRPRGAHTRRRRHQLRTSGHRSRWAGENQRAHPRPVRRTGWTVSLPTRFAGSQRRSPKWAKKSRTKSTTMRAALSKNPTTKDGYRAADAADARKRTLEFLAATLKK